jgi:hypothetical protein
LYVVRTVPEAISTPGTSIAATGTGTVPVTVVQYERTPDRRILLPESLTL